MQTLDNFVAKYYVISEKCSFRPERFSRMVQFYLAQNGIDCLYSLHGLSPGPYLLSYSVFGFYFPLIFRFGAVR